MRLKDKCVYKSVVLKNGTDIFRAFPLNGAHLLLTYDLNLYIVIFLSMYV